jgi:tetratricopeptide (TPR) repeat protein
MAYVNQHYGQAYLRTSKFQEALQYFNESQKIVQKIGDSKMEATNNMFLSETYVAMNKADMAHFYALKADSIAKTYGNTKLRVSTLKALAESNYAIGNYTASHEAFNRHILLSDSLIGIERQKEIANLEQAYQAEKRESVIRLHEKENSLLTLKNKASNNRNIALGISLLLAIAIGYCHRLFLV